MKYLILMLLSSFGVLGISPISYASQYQQCFPLQASRMIRSSAYHPNAYKDGYLKGVHSANNRNTYQPCTAGGEFARRDKDGYYENSYTG